VVQARLDICALQVIWWARANGEFSFDRHKFDFGKEMMDCFWSYLTKIIIDEPNNLIIAIRYQTYHNFKEEIDFGWKVVLIAKTWRDC
jgi:hypothetical protein